MSVVLLDTTVLVSALIEDEAHHPASHSALRKKSACIWSHALAETYSTLTGGRLGLRVPPELAYQLIAESILPRVRVVDLAVAELLAALGRAGEAGARGGAIYDYLHLHAARTAGAGLLLTLNPRHFSALARRGDPAIEMPG